MQIQITTGDQGLILCVLLALPNVCTNIFFSPGAHPIIYVSRPRLKKTDFTKKVTQVQKSTSFISKDAREKCALILP